jgi:hypothetical protein
MKVDLGEWELGMRRPRKASIPITSFHDLGNPVQKTYLISSSLPPFLGSQGRRKERLLARS